MEVEAEEARGGAAAVDLEGWRGSGAGGRRSGGEGLRGASSLFPSFPSLPLCEPAWRASSLYPPQNFFASGPSWSKPGDRRLLASD